MKYFVMLGMEPHDVTDNLKSFTLKDTRKDVMLSMESHDFKHKLLVVHA